MNKLVIKHDSAIILHTEHTYHIFEYRNMVETQKYLHRMYHCHILGVDTVYNLCKQTNLTKLLTLLGWLKKKMMLPSNNCKLIQLYLSIDGWLVVNQVDTL